MTDNANDKRSGAKAMSPQAAEAQALREKIARLRALRLAHEGANPTIADKAPAARSSPRKKEKKQPTKAVPLADWLSTQDQSGRRK